MINGKKVKLRNQTVLQINLHRYLNSSHMG